MPIDPRTLPPWAQKQIVAKLAARNAEKKAAITEKPQETERQKPRKYRNTPTEHIAAGGKMLKFDSKREAARFSELLAQLHAGEISDLRLQPEFTLIEAYTTPSGERVRAERYKADFSYRRNGELVVEDVKSPATKTKVYAIKRKQVLDKYGISITEVM